MGVKNPSTQVLVNVAYALTGWVAASAGAINHDRVGRRSMFLGSTAGMVVCLVAIAGCSAVFARTGSTAVSSTCILFMFRKLYSLSRNTAFSNIELTDSCLHQSLVSCLPSG